ncbi:PEX11 domain-containing protein [Rhexocercosporidium sp. MPI-PUGE-AT-0058]|nr:PEX11 domain-containing protein [Rhexocercosporidium sp. MPI-PUGE-AT-0058]
MPHSNVVTKVSRFVSNAAGLEKTLRLLQSFSQVVAANSLPPAAAPWLQARTQFALGRRYLRFLKFIDAFALAFEAFSTYSGIIAVLEFGKWSCLGMFLLLESCTILDAMGVYLTGWAAGLFVEAMKFWFYSLSMGILLALVELWDLSGNIPLESAMRHGDEREDEKVAEKTAQIQKSRAIERALKRRSAMKKMMIDGCDLFIPGSITGWLVISSSNVGMLCVLSTVLAGFDIWESI